MVLLRAGLRRRVSLLVWRFSVGERQRVSAAGDGSTTPHRSCRTSAARLVLTVQQETPEPCHGLLLSKESTKTLRGTLAFDLAAQVACRNHRGPAPNGLQQAQRRSRPRNI